MTSLQMKMNAIFYVIPSKVSIIDSEMYFYESHF